MYVFSIAFLNNYKTVCGEIYIFLYCVCFSPTYISLHYLELWPKKISGSFLVVHFKFQFAIANSKLFWLQEEKKRMSNPKRDFL